MNGSFANAVRSDWFGPLLVTIVAVAIVGGFNPSFLSPLNIQVLLLAIAVNGLIAFSQMLIIAIGQMNLSVGAIGGLCAIVFAGMMDAWHVPASLAALTALSTVGGNQHAAELSGISIANTVVIAHALSGFLAALAGLLLVARLQMGQPTIGDDWLILSFAAPVIGGAVLAGGHVSVPATLLGVVIVAIITQALVLFDIDPFLVQVVLGAMILAAVGANRFRESRLSRNLKRL